MTVLDAGAAVGLVTAVGATLLLVRPAARASGLGLLHPTVLWLALEVVFFGLGSIVLATADGQPGPALFLSGCILATGLGTFTADRRLRTRWTGRPTPGEGTPRPVKAAAGRSKWIPIVLAIASLAVLLPLLMRVGLPLLASDATRARAELTGLPVQLVRVALPGLAIVILLRLADEVTLTGRRWLDGVLIAAAVGLTVLLASRYLVLELLAAMILAWGLAGHRLPVRTVAIGGLIAVVGFIAVGLVRAPSQIGADPIASTLNRTVSRLFLVQPRTLAALQEVIPAETPYFGGLTWLRRVGPLVGRDDVPNLGYWIYPRVVEEAQDVPGYAAPGLIGEAWANFGVGGVAVLALFGGALGTAGIAVGRHRDRVEDVAAGALVLLFMARTHALGLLGAGLLIVLVGVWRVAVRPRT